MGATVDETLNEIAATRAALERDIDALFGRMPPAGAVAQQAKTYGAAALGAAGLVAVLATKAKKRSELSERRMNARINAEELARAFSAAPPTEHDGSEGRSRTGLLALVVAAAALVLTVMQRNRADQGS